MPIDLRNIGAISPNGTGAVTVNNQLNVTGDVDITGTPAPVYRINGVPLSTGGAVTSVFGRTGGVTATAGDYTAAQVTNAVDSSQSYANPAWITSLDWSKVSNAPAFVTAAGSTGQIQFNAGGTPAILGASANLFWDSTNARMGIGTATPQTILDVAGNIRMSGARSTLFYRGDLPTHAAGLQITGYGDSILSSDIILTPTDNAGTTQNGGIRLGGFGAFNLNTVNLSVSGNIGIGTPNATANLQISTPAASTMVLENFGAGNFITGRSGGGNAASPSPAPAGTILLALNSAGSQSAGAWSFEVPAQIILRAEETFTPSANGGRVEFWATSPGTVNLSEIVRVTGTGIGILTYDPTGSIILNPGAPLDIGGTALPGARQAILAKGVTDPTFSLQVLNGQMGGNAGAEQMRFGLTYGANWNSGIRFLRGVGATDGSMQLDANGTGIVWIDGFTANVGIGAANPTAQLEITANAPQLRIVNRSFTNNNAQLRFATPAKVDLWALGTDIALGNGSNDFQFYDLAFGPRMVIQYQTGNVAIGGGLFPSHLLELSADSAAKPGTNTWTILSDIRTKRNIQKLDGGLDIINQLEPIVAEYNGKAGSPNGQRVVSLDPARLQDILPHSVSTFQAKLNPDDKEKTDILGVNTHEILYHLVLAVQQLSKRRIPHGVES